MGDSESRKRAFTTGYLLGLSGMPVATALGRASDPLYLYGSAALPPYPDEWNREEYPYAVIIGYNHQYHFCAYREPNYYTKTQLGRKFNYFGTQEDGTAQVFTARQGEAAWSQLADTKKEIAVDKAWITYIAIWTHGFDLMYSDGELYVAATEPGRISDWDALDGRWFYNDTVLPGYRGYDNHHSWAIMQRKSENAYLFFDTMMGGFGVNSSNEVYFVTDNIYTTDVFHCYAGGEYWTLVATDTYVEKRYSETFNRDEYYIGHVEDLVWSEEDVLPDSNYKVMMYGSDPVPIPERSVDKVDNRAVVLGCRLGHIVRKQMQKGKADSVPDGALISSDGYILKDSNGLYLCAMKGE